MKDDYRHKGMRRRLVKELERKGISDKLILEAFQNVPRHVFLDAAFSDWAYKDKAFSIGADQTISQPYTVAFQTELLQVKKGDKVLEIGTGSGYQAAILAELGVRVYSIERIEELHEKSKKILSKLGYNNISLFFKDGHEGLEKHSPFDGIIVTAASESIPETLLYQLRIGGKLIIPVGDQKGQVMYSVTRTEKDSFHKKKHGRFRFVPFLKGTR